MKSGAPLEGYSGNFHFSLSAVPELKLEEPVVRLVENQFGDTV
jgi:hypothetical protein